MKSPLTPRQTEVVRLVSLGWLVFRIAGSTQEIAVILGIAVSTADNHKATAMAVLGTDKATLLTRLAIKHKITSADEKLTAAEKRKSGRKNDGWN